jgi:fengycin family lipopeptide synthetase E
MTKPMTTDLPPRDDTSVETRWTCGRTFPYRASDFADAEGQRQVHRCYEWTLAAFTAALAKLTGDGERVLVGLWPPGRGWTEPRSIAIPVTSELSFSDHLSRVAAALQTAGGSGAAGPQHPDESTAERPVGFRLTIDEPGRAPEAEPSAGDVRVSVTIQAEILDIACSAPASAWESQFAEALLDGYAAVLGQVSEQPDVPLRQLRLVTGPSRGRLLRTFNETDRSFRKRTIQEIFEEQVAVAPDRLAVSDGTVSLSYGELNQRANRLAHLLRAAGVGRNQVVGILLDRGVDPYVALFGILKAGAAFLHLDPHHPPERLRHILRDSDCRMVIGRAQQAPQLQLDEDERQLVDLEVIDDPALPATNPSLVNDPADLAYVIYTSGSTGWPKGVPLAHAGIASFDQHYKDSFHFTRGDNVLAFFASTFDGSISEMTMSLLAGTGFYVVPDDVKASHRRFEQFLNRHRITVATIPPPYLSQLDPAAFRHLHTIFVAGSECPAREFQRWSGRYLMVNHYGPTEVTICATEWKCTGLFVSDSPVPIGRPIANKKVYVVNRDLELQPIGIRGELCVSGVRLSDGYLNLAQATEERFVPNPFAGEVQSVHDHRTMYRTGDLASWLPDGNLLYHGRLDNQVKIRGHRVELAEVEQAMLAVDGVKQAAVVLVGELAGEEDLHGFFAGDDTVSAASLRAQVQGRLPEYMVPTQLHKLPALPISASDKIDRRALKSLASQRPTPPAAPPASAASDPVVQQVLLAIARCGGTAVTDTEATLDRHLADLGINSLKFIKMVIEVETACRVEFDKEFFVRYKTLTVREIVGETRTALAGRPAPSAGSPAGEP